MDGGLSVAASGFAVASLAIQLADSLHKARIFWSSIRDASDDIREISSDLKLPSDILNQVAIEIQHHQPDTTLQTALDACSLKVRSLTAILNTVEPGFSSTGQHIRRWTAFKGCFEIQKIKKIPGCFGHRCKGCSIFDRLSPIGL